ncbi:MAG: ATP-binding protein [Alphaproteobacteria bacterium]|nr:ATP-binding protein [Alphaproteobacteria bacterium]
MFLNFKIKNFLSIKDENIIDFSINESQKIDNTSEKVLKSFVNKIGCIVGPNASGKTNILRAFVTFATFIENSYDMKKIQIAPHFFHRDENTSFSCEFIEKDIQYQYSIVLNNMKIIQEKLRKLNSQTNRYNDVYSRDNLSVKTSNDIEINSADLVRLSDNITCFSFLKKLNYFKQKNIEINSFAEILSNVELFHFFGTAKPVILSMLEIAEQLDKDKDLIAKLSKELNNIDTGIDNIFVVETKQKIEDDNNGLVSEKMAKVLGTVHKDNEKEAKIPIIDASDGTQHYIDLFIKVNNILNRGGILIADEIENSLHVDLVERILNLFMKKETNPNNAQILFTTHNPWFLQYLTKTQIFIVEKEHQNTEVFRLDDIKSVRNDENYFMKYITGEYDGKPKIRG